MDREIRTIMPGMFSNRLNPKYGICCQGGYKAGKGGYDVGRGEQ